MEIAKVTKLELEKLIKTPGLSHRLWHLAQTGKDDWSCVPEGSPMTKSVKRCVGYAGRLTTDEVKERVGI